jgi:cysteine desulfurase
MKKIYLDNAASTPIDPRVLKVVNYHEKQTFGNSSSLHFFGEQAKRSLEDSRQIIASIINAKKEEIIFTSSATESNNLVLKGISEAYKNKGKTIIVSAIEHDSILDPAAELIKHGFKIKLAPVDQFGTVDLKKLEKLIDKDTILVSVMHANNEIGTVEPIKEITELCHKNKVLFHTDASQTLGKIKVDAEFLGVNLLTASSHKIYGPKGAAMLYIKEGTKITPQILGGGQEFGLRSSTVNVPAIVGFAKAVELANNEMIKDNLQIKKLTDYLIKTILKNIPMVRLTGHPTNRLSNIASFLFAGVEGESILMALNELGVAVSTGSACSSASLKPSHVLVACGLSQDEIHGSIRVSLSKFTSKEEIDYLIKILPNIIYKLRKISPYGEQN